MYKAATSIRVFRSFIKTRADGTLDASDVVSRDCYLAWMQSKRAVECESEAKRFRRTLTNHVSGTDGRCPFEPLEEAAVLELLRKKLSWPCFPEALSHLGKRYRAKGYHEKLREKLRQEEEEFALAVSCTGDGLPLLTANGLNYDDDDDDLLVDVDLFGHGGGGGGGNYVADVLSIDHNGYNSTSSSSSIAATTSSSSDISTEDEFLQDDDDDADRGGTLLHLTSSSYTTLQAGQPLSLSPSPPPPPARRHHHHHQNQPQQQLDMCRPIRNASFKNIKHMVSQLSAVDATYLTHLGGHLVCNFAHDFSLQNQDAVYEILRFMIFARTARCCRSDPSSTSQDSAARALCARFSSTATAGAAVVLVADLAAKEHRVLAQSAQSEELFGRYQHNFVQKCDLFRMVVAIGGAFHQPGQDFTVTKQDVMCASTGDTKQFDLTYYVDPASFLLVVRGL